VEAYQGDVAAGRGDDEPGGCGTYDGIINVKVYQYDRRLQTAEDWVQISGQDTGTPVTYFADADNYARKSSSVWRKHYISTKMHKDARVIRFRISLSDTFLENRGFASSNFTMEDLG